MDSSIPTRCIEKTFKLKLYPAGDKPKQLACAGGSTRWLWNHLLNLEKQCYDLTGKFLFRDEMEKLLPRLKWEFQWLADTNSHALQRVCRRLDRALKDFLKGKKGFPKYKKKTHERDAFYCANSRFKMLERHVDIPNVGEIRFRGSRLPEGKIMSATVKQDGNSWWCMVQCQVTIKDVRNEIVLDTARGADMGLRDLITDDQGDKVGAPKFLRKAYKRLRRQQRSLSRRQKGSHNRRKQVKVVGRTHRKVRNRRSDVQHKATSGLIAKASFIAGETLNVAGMMTNPHLAKLCAEAGMSETMRQIRYKADWAGVTYMPIDQWEPSTQTCSNCGYRKRGAEKLQPHQRIYRCDSAVGCGHVQDRDHNAAINIRRVGLIMAGFDIRYPSVGKALPERARDLSRTDACGDPSTGPEASASGRHGSRKQELKYEINLV